MGRYKVQMKGFKHGNWYTKCDTDHYPAACSVAATQSRGHECNIIDTLSGKILVHYDEDQSMKEFMLDKNNAYLWRR